MEELVDLPGMSPILDICRLGTSGQLSDLHRFKKLYLSAKVPGMGKFSSELFALALADSGLEPPWYFKLMLHQGALDHWIVAWITKQKAKLLRARSGNLN